MKIMLLTAATGGGHLRASAAVEQYIRDNTGYEVVTIDTLKAVNRFLDKSVCDTNTRSSGQADPGHVRQALQADQPGKTCSPAWCPSSAGPSATCCTPTFPSTTRM